MITACDLADLLTDLAAVVIEAVCLEGRRGAHRCQVTVGAGCVCPVGLDHYAQVLPQRKLLLVGLVAGLTPAD
jgi:hypothetical protein